MINLFMRRRQTYSMPVATWMATTQMRKCDLCDREFEQMHGTRCNGKKTHWFCTRHGLRSGTDCPWEGCEGTLD